MIRTTKAIMIFLFSLGLLTFSIQVAQAQTPHETLTQYIADLQKNPNDNALREKIIRFVQTMSPAPIVPEETVKYEGRAEAAVRNAKTPQDYLDASKEYSKALLLAPWVASYYFNLGVVLEKAGKPGEAITNLRLYLLAAPIAPDVREVQKKIAGLDYEMEMQTKVIEKKPEHGFNGIWRWSSSGGKRDWQISVSDSKLTALCIRFVPSSPQLPDECAWFNMPYNFTATMRGKEFEGTWNTHPVVPPGRTVVNYISAQIAPPKELPIRGYLSPDGNEIEIEYFQYGTYNFRWMTAGIWQKESWIRVK